MNECHDEAARSGSLHLLVIPQPGERWLHYYHGPVTIVRKWWPANDDNDEYVCELESKKPERRLLSASLFEGRLRDNNALTKPVPLK